MKKTSKYILAGIIGFFLFFLIILGALLGYELALVGDETEYLYNIINSDVKHKYYFYEIDKNKGTSEDEEQGKWLEVDGIPIDIEKIQNNEVPMQKYSRLEFELNNQFANNADYTLVDLGFYIWIDLQEGEERSLSFTLEYANTTSESSVDIVFEREYEKGRGVVKFLGLDISMLNIDKFVVVLNCEELNNDNCIEWTFTDMQISYDIRK